MLLSYGLQYGPYLLLIFTPIFVSTLELQEYILPNP